MNKIVFTAVIVIALAFVLTGCTSVTVDKPDGTRITVTTWGSSQVKDMTYVRDPNSITLSLGSTSNTPEGISEVIEPITDAAAAVATGGVSSAAGVIAGSDGD